MNKLTIFLLLIFSLNASPQSGISWETGKNVSSSNLGNFHPRIATDGSGNPMIIWGRSSDGSVFFTRWYGSAFTTPLKLNPSWLSIATASWMGPDIASKGDTVYVVMKRVPEASDTNHIYIVHSFNGGMTFSAPVRVDFIADSISRFPTVKVDETGNPVVAFMKFNSSFLESRWVVTWSTDFGTTFSTDVKASGWSGPGSVVCDCCPGCLAGYENTFAMLYRNNLFNIRDSWVGISNNGGASFSNGWNIDNNNWYINVCPASGPDGVIMGDSLYSVFMSGASGAIRVYRSTYSMTNPGSHPAQSLAGTIPGLNQQNYPRIDRSGDAVAIVWEQTVNGQGQLPVLFTNDVSNGFPSSYDTVDLNDVTNADVALSNGNIYVAWEDDNSGTIKYRKGIYSPVNTYVNKIRNNQFSVYPNPASEHISIDLTYIQGKLKTVNIFELTGKKISGFLTEENKVVLNISDYPSGIYFVKVSTGYSNFTGKFCKN